MAEFERASILRLQIGHVITLSFSAFRNIFSRGASLPGSACDFLFLCSGDNSFTDADRLVHCDSTSSMTTGQPVLVGGGTAAKLSNSFIWTCFDLFELSFGFSFPCNVLTLKLLHVVGLAANIPRCLGLFSAISMRDSSLSVRQEDFGLGLGRVFAQQVFQFQLFGHYRLLKKQQHDLMSVTTLEYVSILHQGQGSYMHM